MRGEPTHLAALVRWFMDAARDEAPAKLHYVEELDEMGTPEWTAQFRTWIIARRWATDDEGYVKYPVAFYLALWHGEGRESRVSSTFLFRLLCLDGDWLRAMRTITPLTEDGEVVARLAAQAILQRFWRQMQTMPHKFVRRPRDKSEAQHAAEEGA